jgi:hypothetical protein
MRITINIDEPVSKSPPVWKATLPPDEVRQLSPPLTSAGGASVIFVDDPDYEPKHRQLAFAFGKARVLNLGDSPQVVIVGATPIGPGGGPVSADAATNKAVLGLGDRQMLSLIRSSKLPDDLKDAGTQLVEFARSLDPAGDLRHEGQRYVNRQDNWVTFQIQPQVREILVTYKGSVPNRLKATSSARRPYCGFKLRGLQDIEEAKRVLRGATRRH